MTDLNDAYATDNVLMAKVMRIPREPHVVVFHGGPLHGKRQPYDPSIREMVAMEPVETGMLTDKPCMVDEPRFVRYRLKPVKRTWDMEHTRTVTMGRRAVGATWLGRIVYADILGQRRERITFADHAYGMVADGWESDPRCDHYTGGTIVEESDCYGRTIIGSKTLWEKTGKHEVCSWGSP